MKTGTSSIATGAVAPHPAETGQEEAQFRAAGQLICAAVELDWAKRGFAPHLRTAAIGLVRELCKLADELAGERIEEPFSAEDRGCGETEKPDTAGPGWAAVAGGLS